MRLRPNRLGVVLYGAAVVALIVFAAVWFAYVPSSDTTPEPSPSPTAPVVPQNPPGVVSFTDSFGRRCTLYRASRYEAGPSSTSVPRDVTVTSALDCD